MYRLTIFILIIHFSTLLFAEGNDSIKSHKNHLFAINTGYSKHVIRDDAISPFIYRGAKAPLELNYKYLGTKTRHIFSAFYDQLKLNSSIPDYSYKGLNHYVQNINLYFGYSYQRKLFRFSNNYTMLFIGGEIKSLLNFRYHNFVYNTGYIMLDQFNSLALNALIEKRFTNDRQILFINISIPFISYALMRGTYNHYVGEKIDPLDLGKNVLPQIAKNGDFIAFNNLFDIKTDISFVRFLNKHIGVELKYSLHFYKFTQYDNLLYSKSLQNQFLMGFVLKL